MMRYEPTITAALPPPRVLPVALLGVGGAIAGAALVDLTAHLTLISRLGMLLLAFLGLLAWPLVRELKVGTFDPLEFRHAFLAFLALYCLSLPTLTYFNGDSVSHEVSTPAVVEAFSICLVSLVCYLLGYHASFAARVASRIPEIGPISTTKLTRATIIVSVLALLWLAAFIYAMGGLSGFLGVGYTDLYEAEEGKELLGFSMTQIPTCVLLLYALAHRTRSRVAWPIFLSSFCLAAILLLTGSRRRLLFTMIVALAVYRHYVVKRMSFKLLLGLMLGGAMAASVLGVLRAIPPEQLLNRRTFEFVAEQPTSQIFYTFLESGEAASDFETFPFIVQEVSNGMPYRWGRTYLEAPLLWIPKVIYPARPETPSQWYTSKFFPKIAARLGGNPLFILAEAYLNFGFLGPPVLMLLLGILSRVAYLFLQRNHFSSAAVLVYAIAVSWIPSAIRIDLATTLKVSVASSLPVIVAVIWYSRNRRSDGSPLLPA